jgi:hypothetical protein
MIVPFCTETKSAGNFTIFDETELVVVDSFQGLISKMDKLIRSQVAMKKIHVNKLKLDVSFSLGKEKLMNVCVFGDLKPQHVLKINQLAEKHKLTPVLESPFYQSSIGLAQKTKPLQDNKDYVELKAGKFSTLSQLPICDDKKKLMVHHLYKCGSTFVKHWLMHALSTEKIIKEFQRHPHLWTSEHHWKKTGIKKKLSSSLMEKYFNVVVVRNPYNRVVSAFLEAGRNPYIKAEIAKALGISDSAVDKITFNQFLDALEKLDINNCDMHLQAQTTLPIWRNKKSINYIAKLENLRDSLMYIHKRFSYSKEKEYVLESAKNKRKKTKFIEGWECSNIPMDKLQGDIPGRKADKSFPHIKNFYTAETLRRVEKIYAEDISTLNYSF